MRAHRRGRCQGQRVPGQVRDVREYFGGKVTYAAVPLENIDWAPFDFMSLDLYRSAETADRFAAGIQHLVAQGKPVAITEFGAAGYQGAGDRGARGLEIVEYDGDIRAPAATRHGARL